jgi:hypothetical protein
LILAKKQGFSKILDKPFYAKRTQWYVIGIQIAVEYELLINSKNVKQSQIVLLVQHQKVWCCGFLVDIFSQLIKIISSLLIISPVNDKINQS